MDEDVYGPLRELGVRRHVNCALCGRLVQVEQAVWVEGKIGENNPDYQVLCHECAATRQEPVVEEESSQEGD